MIAAAEHCAEVDRGVLRRRMRVQAVDAGVVVLEAHRATACAACAARTGCGAGALAEMTGGVERLRLPAPTPLAVGDEVVVAMEDGAFLGIALRAYLLPPVALAVMACVALAAKLPDELTALACLVSLGLSFLPLRRAERAASQARALWIEGRAEPAPEKTGPQG